MLSEEVTQRLAKRLGIAQPNLSALLNYRLDNFSSEKLLEFFKALGYDAHFLIRPVVRARRGTTHVLVAAKPQVIGRDDGNFITDTRRTAKHSTRWPQ